MTKKSQPGKGRSSLVGFADRLERGSPLSDVSTSRRQLGLLRSIAAHASQECQRTQAHRSGAGLTKSRGPAFLFAGRNASAKIRAVAALGRELGLDVYRVNLSAVVSKYIGETEKNLRYVFDAAESSGAILFFDEAEALFGKRSEVKDSHDRYANLEIGYFLGRMETCNGLAILSARRSEGLSDALLRRVETIVAFPAQKIPRKSR